MDDALISIEDAPHADIPDVPGTGASAARARSWPRRRRARTYTWRVRPLGIRTDAGSPA